MNLVRTILLIAVAAACAQAGEISRLKQAALLDEANTAFQKALDSKDSREAVASYRKGIAAFESLIAGGCRNGKLYYNLGNAYFRTNDISRAILNYRRSLRLIPGDSHVRENLKYARSRTQDKIETSGKSALIRNLFFWHFDMSLRSRTIAAIVFYVLVWALLIAAVIVRARWLRWPIIGAVALTLALAASCAIDHYSRSHHLEGVITAEQVTVRKGNGISYEPQFKEPLHSGTEFSVIEVRGTWLHVGLADGKTGWIQASAAEII